MPPVRAWQPPYRAARLERPERYRARRARGDRHKFDAIRLTLLRLADSQIRARSKHSHANRFAYSPVNKELIASQPVAICGTLLGSYLAIGNAI